MCVGTVQFQLTGLDLAQFLAPLTPTPQDGKSGSFRVKVKVQTKCGEMSIKMRVAVSGEQLAPARLLLPVRMERPAVPIPGLNPRTLPPPPHATHTHNTMLLQSCLT